jgi:peptidoglycan-associated lipoprotein
MQTLSKILRIALLTTICCSLALTVGCSKKGSSKEGKEGEEGTLSEAELNALREKRFGEGGIPTAEGEGIFKDVAFDYDSSTVREQARFDVEYNAKVLKDNPTWNITLEGHCDERGTNDYNLALGQERAKAVQEVLVSLGVSRSRIDLISYGEEVPLDASGTEAAFAKNRRVHFSAHGSDTGR